MNERIVNQRSILAKISMWAISLTALFVSNAYATVSSDFELGADGWIGHACEGLGLCADDDIDWTAFMTHHADGGSPAGGGMQEAGNGYIDLRDPGEPGPPGVDYAARLEPNPVKYAGAFTEGSIVKFDALIRRNGGGGFFDAPDGFPVPIAPLLAIESGSGTLIYISTDLPTPDGDWKPYTVPLTPDPALVDLNGWVLVVGAAISDPDAATFSAALAGQTQVTVIAEWLKEGDEVETGGIDNFRVVPIPAAFPLLLSAVIGLRLLRRS